MLYCVERYGVVILVGQTGSGKTTRARASIVVLTTLSLTLVELPQYLYETGWAAEGSVIACTQPRRVSATSVANRVATEVGTILGEEVSVNVLGCLRVCNAVCQVGYTIRFEDVSDKQKTRVLYLTDGMLFRETLVDPLLSRYSAIIVRTLPHHRYPVLILTQT